MFFQHFFLRVLLLSFQWWTHSLIIRNTRAMNLEKWSQMLNGSYETTKILEENICSKISDISHSNCFADTSPRARETKEKQMGLHQTKKLLHSKRNHQWNENGTHYLGCVYEFLFACFSCIFFCCFQFYIPHMTAILWLLTFSVWVILLSMIFSRSISSFCK